MILFFIILGIFFLIILLTISIFLSSLEIEIKKLLFESNNKTIIFLIFIKLKFLDKITLTKFKIDNKEIEKYKSINNKILNKINLNSKNVLLNSIKMNKLEKLNYVIKKINLKIEIGAFNPMITCLTCRNSFFYYINNTCKKNERV